MRKDPPLDSEFSTPRTCSAKPDARRCQGVQQTGSLCAIAQLGHHGISQFIRPTFGSHAQPDAIKAFHAEHKDIILKPLDGIGGMGVLPRGCRWHELGLDH
jgi:glutathione synthase